MTTRLVVAKNKVRENMKRIITMCARSGIGVVGVTKGVCSHPSMVQTFWEAGCRAFADSRISNLAKIRMVNPETRLMLLRVPMKSELANLPYFADNVMVSDITALQQLNSVAYAHSNRVMSVTLMIELGDLREGILPEEAEKFADVLAECPNIYLRGVAANFACFGGILPTRAKLEKLLDVSRMFRSRGFAAPVCSGGSTSSLALLESGEMPEGINELRVGEGALFGTDVANRRNIGWLEQETMVLETELVEVRRKPSKPYGVIGADIYGDEPVYEDMGERLRAIAAIGRQDVRIEGLTPLDKGIRILGASSDHMVLDIENARSPLSWGSIVRFSVDYGAMMALFMSKYVNIEFR